jgi:peptidoglycan-N-acetylglucosamine deacetylase
MYAQKARASAADIFHNYILYVAALLLLLVSVTLAIEHETQTPQFTLDESQGGVARIAPFSLRTATDWVAGKKYAVLTFDDAPYGHGVDEQILKILQRHHVHAIFFLICNHIDESTVGLLGKFEGYGHLIGNHSYDHPHLTQLQAPELYKQIEGCSQRIADVTGHRPHYFRPPYGMSSPLIKRMAEASGMQQMLWNANSHDWQTNPQRILNLSLQETDDKSILLMHDRPTTASILDETLTDLEQRGFQFVLPDQISPDS